MFLKIPSVKIKNINYSLLNILFIKYKLFFNLLFFVKNICNKYIKHVIINNNILEIHVKNKYFMSLLFCLKYQNLLKFNLLTDICVLDFPERNSRFFLIYNFLSIYLNTRINVFLQTSEMLPVYSISYLFKCATWIERECWDMFGIFFFKNNDLRRILSDYGFQGHPLRKDFPLTGYFEVFYDDAKKSIVTTKVSLAQEYRNFYFNSPWITK